MTPVEREIEEVDGVAGPTSVEEEAVTVMVVFRVSVSVAVIVAVGPTGEVELEKEDGVTGEPSVEDVLPPVERVIVYVVPVEIVSLLVTVTLLETPVGPTGKLEPVPYPDGL